MKFFGASIEIGGDLFLGSYKQMGFSEAISRRISRSKLS